MKTDVCPDHDLLDSHLLGKLHGEQADSIDQHIEICDQCLATAQEVDATDELTEGIRAGKPVLHGSENGIEQVIERGKLLYPQTKTIEADETVSDYHLPQSANEPKAAIGGARKNIDSEIDFLAPPEQPGEIGRLGRYRVLEWIGSGGMGVVFRAEDPKLKRQIALKVMKPVVAASRSNKKRFRREAQAQAAVRHDNIVDIYENGEDLGIPYIAMPFLRGESLQTRLKRETKLEQCDVLKIGREVAAGLAAAHQHGLIHRDIKPDNIWIEENTGRTKILDFGLVRTEGDDAGLTQSGMAVGTPKYMAPEQAQGQSVDHRCDLFSLGSVLYHLVTGKTPFSGGNCHAILRKVSYRSLEPLDAVCPTLNPDFAKLIMRLLEKDREQRPETAAEVVRLLTRIESSLRANTVQFDETLENSATTNQPVTPPPVISQTAKPSEPPTSGNGGHDNNYDPQPASPLPNPVTETTWCGIAKTFAVMAAVLLVPSLIYLAGNALFRLATPDGTLVVSVTGDDFVTTVKGKKVTIENTLTHDKYTVDLLSPEQTKKLPRGEYKLLLTVSSGLKTRTDRFTITGGKNAKVEVWWEPKATKVEYVWPKDQPAPAIAPFTAEQAKEHQTAYAKHLGVPVETTNSIGMKFRVIPPGEFRMGSGEGEILKLVAEAKEQDFDNWLDKSIPDEGPQHKVVLTKIFSLAIHEVTRSQFRRFVEATGYKTDAEKDKRGGFGWKDGNWVRDPKFLWNTDLGFETEQTDDHPVVNVTWNDSVAFCCWLSKKEGVTSRLPTEAEWEFACRAGSLTRFSCGNEISLLKWSAWYTGASRHTTNEVGTKAANAFGLFDMHGNVWEWCADRHGPYTRATVIDPAGSSQGEMRVMRGGAVFLHPTSVRSAVRGYNTPNSPNDNFGFRIVRSFQKAKPATIPSDTD
ncbi:MAG: SUMF1/EgtB/PvdO family nonheme iron enzyme [Planctomycetaceae bacterium]|jgi:eukaryotic-like serine/threonine-protein kinase|nr:SUMF1/EgtB/PvdO family nonheme iron enzyme [Planctomycetaceae bacterium]MBT6483290.1 SUMF1/EgtB/PvdO family nonheme iron enzyme [Planctomycetaceae bacterium]MBT6494617.1 SUMF1/EgtB/PvdO family nonheme iron enzyme [Planctomycetaceae bacterium]